ALELPDKKLGPNGRRLRDFMTEQFTRQTERGLLRGWEPLSEEAIDARFTELRDSMREQRVTATEMEGFKGHDGESRPQGVKEAIDAALDRMQEHANHEGWEFKSRDRNNNLTVTVNGKDV